MLVFEDRSLSRALDKARRALGSQALILRVEQVPWGDGSLVRVHAAAGPAPRANLVEARHHPGTRNHVAARQRPSAEREHATDAGGHRTPTIALVGPPGAGKSTAAVKLARHLERDRSWESGITHLTGNDPRLGELVRAAGLELDATRAAATSRPSPIVRIVDTPGLLPDGSPTWQEFTRDLRRMRPRLVHLVLPASTDPDWAAATVGRWREASVNRLLITQIEAVEPARIARLVRASGLRLSFLGHGASVEEDLIGRRRGDIRRYFSDGEWHAESNVRAA